MQDQTHHHKLAVTHDVADSQFDMPWNRLHCVQTCLATMFL